MSVTRRLRIHGRVQGVFFRGWSVTTARSLGLRGWVRNRRDGSVEAVFAGPEQAVTAAIEACRSGPRGARVAAVDVEEGDASLLQHREGARFVVLRTA